MASAATLPPKKPTTLEELRAALERIVEESFGVGAPDPITPQTTLVSDLGADSLDLVELAMAIEEDILHVSAEGENIPEDVIADWKHSTVGDVMRYCAQRLGLAAPAA